MRWYRIACLFFSRSRWVGADETVDFAGFLFSINTMLADVVPAWVRELGTPTKPVTLADFTTRDRLSDANMRHQGLRLLEGCVIDRAADDEGLLAAIKDQASAASELPGPSPLK